jgi:hypothetical protein
MNDAIRWKTNVIKLLTHLIVIILAVCLSGCGEILRSSASFMPSMVLSPPRLETRIPEGVAAPSSLVAIVTLPTVDSTPTPPTSIETVCASGCDFTTIQAAIDHPGTLDGAIIEVIDPVHTEAGIVVQKDVTIQGLGFDETIVQAHADPAEAPDRVFLIAKDTHVIIRDLTIRHGNPPFGDDYNRCGGGIANEGTLLLENCVVSHNSANNGGGLWSRDGTLTIVNSAISHNVADRLSIDFENETPSPSAVTACGSGGGIKLVRGDIDSDQ